MKEIIRKFLLITNVVSFSLVLLFGASGLISDLFGIATYEKILEKLKIPWNYKSVWIFAYICLIILLITYYLRQKFFINKK